MARVATPIKNVPFFLKKITPKFVTEAMNQALLPTEHINLLQLPRPVQPRHLYDLYGILRVATIVEDKAGVKAASVRFSGKLKAYTPADENGEQFVFESGQAFIPVLDTYLYSALKSAQEAEAGAYLEVALSIGYKEADPTKPSMTGYEWDVQNLITQAPRSDDPIERLRAEAKSQALLLSAPKPTASAEGTPTVGELLRKEAAPSVGGTFASVGTSSGTNSTSKSATENSSPAAPSGSAGASSSAATEPATGKHGKGRHATV
jgi:hypothetical protein